MPMVVSAAAATAAADGAPRGTVCTDGAATAQDPSRSFIATPAAVAFRPPGQPALRPSVRPSVQPSLAGSNVDVGKARAQRGIGDSRG